MKATSLREQMIRLTKIEIWYYEEHNFMTGVRVTLSNGQQSPLFHTKGEQNGPITLCIEQDKRPGKIAVRSCKDGVYGMKIMDRNNEDIVNWTGDLLQPWKEQIVPNNQNIVGIYGLNNFGGHGIQNFGFITLSYF